MAALTITVAEVQRAEEYGQRTRGRTLEAITTGQAVYYDAEEKSWGKASAVSTAPVSGFGTDANLGIALSTSFGANGQIQIQLDGDVILGASAGIVPGTVYGLGSVAGSIYPLSDITIVQYRTLLGVGGAAGVLRLMPFATGLLPGSIVNDFQVKWLFASQATDNTPLVSPILDILGSESVTFFLQTGTLADADATFTVLLEHGDAANLSDAAAVPDADMVSQEIGVAPEVAASFAFADDNEVRKLGYAAATPKRYLRLTITPAGNTGLADIMGYCILGATASLPVAQGLS